MKGVLHNIYATILLPVGATINHWWRHSVSAAVASNSPAGMGLRPNWTIGRSQTGKLVCLQALSRGEPCCGILLLILGTYFLVILGKELFWVMAAGLTKRDFNNWCFLGSGCGAVGRAVASDTRGVGFESRHWYLLFKIFSVKFFFKKWANPGLFLFILVLFS